MANQIKLAQGYSAVIDEVYQAASTSAVLNSDRGLAKAGASAKEIVIPKVSVTGLGDYDRNSGYTQGSVTLEYETVTFDYDRGCAIVVDAMDAAETEAVNAFAVAESELQRTQVAPESDAYTFAKLAGSEGVTTVTADYADALAVLNGLDEAMGAMDEAQVSGGRILFITPTLARKVRAYNASSAASTNSAHVWEEFAQVVEVPQARFYSAITLNDGKDGANFGYKKATDGHNLNWMIVEPTAVFRFDKHVHSRILSPDELENMDAYKLKYRKYGIAGVFANKAAGVAVSVASA